MGNIEMLDYEANYCLLCKNARCQKYCPVNTPIPEIIKLYKNGEHEKAAQILFDNNPLSAICGIVCDHKNQCSGNCIRGIKGEPVKFFEIEQYLSGKFLKENTFKKPEKLLDDRVAIIGSGPAGITMAFMLAQKGYRVTIFESKSAIGGVLRYGIPEFRLSKDIVDRLYNHLIDLGVKIRFNTLVGPAITIDKLFTDYTAIFISTGTWNPKTLGLKGETLGHVYYAIDYLKAPENIILGDKVCVIGGGNVAMDAARTAKRAGSKDVKIIYRNGEESLSASDQEIQETIDDGVRFEFYRNTTEITDDGIKVEISEPIFDEEGNTISVNESEAFYECDTVIIAVGQNPRNNIVANNKGFQTDRGLLVVDEHGNTTVPGVYASGDVVTGSRNVVAAVQFAKNVAESIDKYCKSLRQE
ncbi:MAG: NAD(P)-dependent oxidoreductase [Clostridiales bacterium]|nr:NAD(P)-dependent oxidoreductase [Clostridiales bacterium]